MHEPWWVYGLIAFGCALLYLLAKVVEHRIKDDGMMFMMTWTVGLIGFCAAIKSADMLKIFG